MARSPAEELDVDGTAVRLSNPDKIYFPQLGEKGGRKRDLVEYYRTVALDGALLNALRDRPTFLQRFPDGIEGEEIYQKGSRQNVPSMCNRRRSPSRPGARPMPSAPPAPRTSSGPRTWVRSRSIRGRRSRRTTTIRISCASISIHNRGPTSPMPAASLSTCCGRCSTSSGCTAIPRPRAVAGYTSMCRSSRGGTSSWPAAR